MKLIEFTDIEDQKFLMPERLFEGATYGDLRYHIRFNEVTFEVEKEEYLNIIRQLTSVSSS